MMHKVKPFTPKEAMAHRDDGIPAFVIEIFNTMLSKKLSDGGRAVLMQKELSELIQKHQEYRGEDLSHLLSVERLFEQYGWTVTYEKADWNSTNGSYFTFVIAQR